MKNPTSQSGFFNSRVLLAFRFCSAGVLLAMLSFGQGRAAEVGPATYPRPGWSGPIAGLSSAAATGGTGGAYLRPGQTDRASVSSSGGETNGHSGVDFQGPINARTISADGRYVVFASAATNLVPGDTNVCGNDFITGAPIFCTNIFVHDRQTGTTDRVSVASDGTQGNGNSEEPAISGDGRYVAFTSVASNLVPGDTNDKSDVFVHDRQTGATERVSVASDGTEGNNTSYQSSVSGDGRYVAFTSVASNLVAGDTNFQWDVFVRLPSAARPTLKMATWLSASQAIWSAPVIQEGRYPYTHAFRPSGFPPGG